MKIQEKFYLQPSFWAGIAVLVCFFMPIPLFSWLNPERQLPQSGFELALNQKDYSILAYGLFVLPLAALYLIVAELFGIHLGMKWAKRSIIITLATFMAVSVISIFHWGFWLSVGLGGYLWWDTLQDKQGSSQDKP